MKVIFLDIDGVLCSIDYMNARHFKFRSDVHTGKEKYPIKDCDVGDEFGNYFDDRCVLYLESILNFTGAKIVISSTWRKKGLQRMKNLWDYRYLPGEVVGITPVLNKSRGEEIEEYLQLNDDITSFVIIDDNDDMLFYQHLDFVKTNSRFGLTLDDAQKAIKILNNE